eukprot:gene45138-55214_t
MDVVFSGPYCKADDLIVQRVLEVQQNMRRNVVLVTDDQLLRKRCSIKSLDSRLEKKKAKKLISASDSASGSMPVRELSCVTSGFFADLLQSFVPADQSSLLVESLGCVEGNCMDRPPVAEKYAASTAKASDVKALVDVVLDRNYLTSALRSGRTGRRLRRIVAEKAASLAAKQTALLRALPASCASLEGLVDFALPAALR